MTPDANAPPAGAPGGESLLGLDIGGTKCAAVAGTERGEVVDRVEWPSGAGRGWQTMRDDILAHARAMLERHPSVRAVGVSIGGPLDAGAGVIQSPPNLPGWDRVPLKGWLEGELGRPVRVEHDAAACARAECLWGAGRGAERVAYLTCGTGFGVGLVFGGRAYYGARGHNCEIGHVRYRDDGPEAFGKRGSFEAYCAGASLGRLAAWKYPRRWPIAPSGQELAQLARAGDSAAQDILSINARATGHACALLADLLYPDLILLGSLARYLGESWLEGVRRGFAEEALADAAKLCRIEPAALGPRLQDCSALAAAI